MSKVKNTTAAARALVEIHNVNGLKYKLKKDPENTKIIKDLEEATRTFAVLALEGFDDSILRILMGEPKIAETIS